VVGSAGTWQGPFSYGGPFGYQTDGDSGLLLLGHRYYDPTLGRFLSRDPIKDGRNWYTYCANNPVRFADPEGTDFVVIVYLTENPTNKIDPKNRTGTHAVIIVQDPKDREWGWYISHSSNGLEVKRVRWNPEWQKSFWEPGWEGDDYKWRARRTYYYYTTPQQDEKILGAIFSLACVEPYKEGTHKSWYNVGAFNCSTIILYALVAAGIIKLDKLPSIVTPTRLPAFLPKDKDLRPPKEKSGTIPSPL
jgi:RHS repeat-associated protein